VNRDEPNFSGIMPLIQLKEVTHKTDFYSKLKPGENYE